MKPALTSCFIVLAALGAAIWFAEDPPQAAPCNCVPCTDVLKRANERCEAREEILRLRTVLNQCEVNHD